MIIILEILVAIIIFGIIIFVHEFGHFIVAKWMGIKVNEFSMGMGPLLLKHQKGDTQYSLRAFPIGGYCAMEGEDDESEDPNAFTNKPVLKRIFVVIAGVIMNFILGYILLLIAVGLCTTPQDGENVVSFTSTIISAVNENSTVYQGGLRAGDKILTINNKRVVSDIDMMYILQSSNNNTFDFEVLREVDGKKSKVHLEKIQFQSQMMSDGNSYLVYDFTVKPIKKSFITVLTRSAKLEYSYSVLIWRGFGDILTGKYGVQEMSGPVGATDVIVGAVDDAVNDAVEKNSLDGLYTLLMLVVLITVNVGIFNIIPLPALDGGRLIFLLIEFIFHKRVPAKYEGLVHAIGLVLLLLFSLFITYNDILKIFQK